MVDTQGILLGVVVSKENMGELLGAIALVMEQGENIPEILIIPFLTKNAILHTAITYM